MKIDHKAIKTRSYTNLALACVAEKKKSNYNSDLTRDNLKREFEVVFGAEAFEWQVDVAEAILLGLDCVVVAGTGAGKTIPFMLPLLLKRDKASLLISPLKILQSEMVRILVH